MISCIQTAHHTRSSQFTTDQHKRHRARCWLVRARESCCYYSEHPCAPPHLLHHQVLISGRYLFVSCVPVSFFCRAHITSRKKGSFLSVSSQLDLETTTRIIGPESIALPTFRLRSVASSEPHLPLVGLGLLRFVRSVDCGSLSGSVRRAAQTRVCIVSFGFSKLHVQSLSSRGY